MCRPPFTKIRNVRMVVASHSNPATRRFRFLLSQLLVEAKFPKKYSGRQNNQHRTTRQTWRELMYFKSLLRPRPLAIQYLRTDMRAKTT